MKRKLILIVISLSPILACSHDSNSEPKYGETALPSNCRSYIQVSVDAWRAGEYDAEETMNAIERNCGMYGSLWEE